MGGQSFVGYVQIFCNKTATRLKIMALVAYPVPAVLMKFMYSFWPWLVENGHTVVEYVLVKKP